MRIFPGEFFAPLPDLLQIRRCDTSVGIQIEVPEQEIGAFLIVGAVGKILHNAEMPGSVFGLVAAGNDDFRDRDPEFLKRAVDQRIADEILRLEAESGRDRDFRKVRRSCR